MLIFSELQCMFEMYDSIVIGRDGQPGLPGPDGPHGKN